MSDHPESLILRLLRRVDEKLDRLGDDVHDLKGRTSAVEEGVVGIHRRLDRMDVRLERVERRLDLVEPH